VGYPKAFYRPNVRLYIEHLFDMMGSVIQTSTEDTMATDLARAILAAGSPWAARWPDGTFNSALYGTAPFGEAQ
jgi:hypothetical protein